MLGLPRFHASFAIAAAGLLAALLPIARAEDRTPLPTQPPGDVLRIPGAPPIQLPPGARVFGPNGPAASEPPATRPGRDAAAGGPPGTKSENAKVAEPKPDLNEPAGRKKILDDLFDRLGKAEDDRQAAFLTAAIERVWMRSGSDTADLLMSRAMEAMNAKDLPLTEEVLDKVVTILPDWAEGWNKRATARFTADDYPGAIEDIAHTLALEPRHFGALSGLGYILQKLELNKRALQAFRKALEVNPRQEDLRKIVEKLSLEVDGRDL